MTPIVPEPIPIKQCTRCGTSYPATTEFWYRYKRGKDGLQAECKQCQSEYNRQWHEANREQVRDRRYQYHKANSDRLCERSRQWQKANAEKVREYQRRYHEVNLDKERERRRRWQKANPDKIRGYAHRRRALKHQAEGSHTAAELKAQYKRQKGRCYWCGDRLNGEYHADHVIPLVKGGDNYISNIVCACPVCNASKHDKLPHEWGGSGGRMF